MKNPRKPRASRVAQNTGSTPGQIDLTGCRYENGGIWIPVSRLSQFGIGIGATQLNAGMVGAGGLAGGLGGGTTGGLPASPPRARRTAKANAATA